MDAVRYIITVATIFAIVLVVVYLYERRVRQLEDRIRMVTQQRANALSQNLVLTSRNASLQADYTTLAKLQDDTMSELQSSIALTKEYRELLTKSESSVDSLIQAIDEFLTKVGTLYDNDEPIPFVLSDTARMSTMLHLVRPELDDDPDAQPLDMGGDELIERLIDTERLGGTTDPGYDPDHDPHMLEPGFMAGALPFNVVDSVGNGNND